MDKWHELDWTKAIWHFMLDQFGELVASGRERMLWDRTRVDVMTRKFAFEVDWAPKWPEAIGQCYWYAANTGRQPGVILLVKNFVKEARYVYRCQVVCARQNLTLWLVDTSKAEIIIDSDRYKLAV